MNYKVNCIYATTLIDPQTVEANSKKEAISIARRKFEEHSAKWEQEGGLPRLLLNVEVE